MAERLILSGTWGLPVIVSLRTVPASMPWLKNVTQGSLSAARRVVHLAAADERRHAPSLDLEPERVPVADLVERRIDRHVAERPAELGAIERLQVDLGPDGQAAVGSPDRPPRAERELAVELKLAAQRDGQIQKIAVVAGVMSPLAIAVGPVRNRVAFTARL